MKNINLTTLLLNLKRFSMQALVILGALNSLYLMIPADMVAMLPPAALVFFNAVVVVYGYLGRLLPQPKVEAQIQAAEIKQ